jgi:hypothetical protein
MRALTLVNPTRLSGIVGRPALTLGMKCTSKKVRATRLKATY